MVSMRYGDKVVADFEQIVKLLIPPAQCCLLSIQRCPWSTFGGGRIPSSHSSAARLASSCRRRLACASSILFPFERGRGKASFTDLMITASSAAVAIEAKFTEPRGETVHKWLRDPPETNRTDVLEGWLDLIGK